MLIDAAARGRPTCNGMEGISWRRPPLDEAGHLKGEQAVHAVGANSVRDTGGDDGVEPLDR